MIQRVCVFCASSSKLEEGYLRPAFQLGQLLASEGIAVVYGGGAVGLMGAVAAGALSRGGHVVGVIPRFMVEREWAHRGVQELIVVQTMNERKERMRALWRNSLRSSLSSDWASTSAPSCCSTPAASSIPFWHCWNVASPSALWIPAIARCGRW